MKSVLDRSVGPLIYLILISSVQIVSAQPDLYTWAHPAPHGNTIYGIVFSDTLNGWAVGGGGEVSSTTDGGTTWQLLHQPQRIAKALYDIILLSDGSLLAAGEAPALIRSFDAGLHWSPVPHPQVIRIRDLALIPGGGVAAVGDTGRIFVAYSNALEWQDVSIGGNALPRHQLWFSAASGIVVGRDVRHRTDDSGATWQEQFANSLSGENTVFQSDTSTVHIFSDFSSSKRSIGDTAWTVTQQFTPPSYGFRAVTVTPLHWFLVTHGEEAELWETTDGGKQWTELFTQNTVGFPCLVRLSNGRLLMGTDAGDIYYSDDNGKTVKNATINYGTKAPSAPMALFIRRSGSVLFAANRPDVFDESPEFLQSNDGGRHWFQHPQPPSVGAVQLGQFFDAERGIVCGYSKMNYTEDGGVTWKPSQVPADLQFFSLSFASADAWYAAAGSTIAGSGEGALVKSNDQGKTWNKVSSGLPQSGLRVYAVAFADAQNGILSGILSETLRYYRTVNGGAVWTEISAEGLTAPATALHWIDSNTLLAGLQFFNGYGIFRSTDSGLHWTKVSDYRVNRFAFRSGTEAMAYIQGGDLLYTKDAGVSWSIIQPPFSGPFPGLTGNINAVSFSNEGWLFGGERNSILLGGTKNSSSVGNWNGITPAGFQLFQNYPNPFNPSTTIGFTPRESGPITLKIYDMLGREVITLVNELLEAGMYHQKMFDASTLASGIYFARLRNGNAVQIKKLILMK